MMSSNSSVAKGCWNNGFVGVKPAASRNSKASLQLAKPDSECRGIFAFRII